MSIHAYHYKNKLGHSHGYKIAYYSGCIEPMKFQSNYQIRNLVPMIDAESSKNLLSPDKHRRVDVKLAENTLDIQ